jgi:hypothetical protein
MMVSLYAMAVAETSLTPIRILSKLLPILFPKAEFYGPQSILAFLMPVLLLQPSLDHLLYIRRTSMENL